MRADWLERETMVRTAAQFVKKATVHHTLGFVRLP